MTTSTYRLAAALLATSIFSAPAFAQTDGPAPVRSEADVAASPFAGSVPADDQVLNAATAREDLSLVASSQQSSNVSGNQVNGTSTTGDIRLGENAFQGSSGLTIINANSGNNVGMNAALNVNVIMTPTSPQ